MTRLGCGLGLLALMIDAAAADAQSVTNMAALKGLAPVSALSKSVDGMAALGSNFTVTGGIQTGAIRQPTLLPFAEQQQQALRDAFITDGNLVELTDGFGTTLGAAYAARAHYLDRERFTSIAKSVSDVIAYANSTSRIGFQRRQVFLRQRHDEWQKAGFRRGPGHLQDDRWRARSLRHRLWPARRNARCRQVRGFPPVPDRARDPAYRRARLLQCPGRQRRL